MDKFRNKYRIASARAKWHDYDGGVYFVTICTKNKEYFFGYIKHDEMHLSIIGRCVFENLENVSKHYVYAEVPLFVVMPNHIHAIIFIDYDRDVACNASKDKAINNTNTANQSMSIISPKRGTLAVVIRGIKSAVTKYANENGVAFGWQERYHEHIIRNTGEMNRIADYIENNIARWESDCFF